MSKSYSTMIAIDYSGSTGGNSYYWDKVGQVVRDNQDGEIIFWDTSVSIPSNERAQDIIRRRQGNGGTSPEVVAEHIVQNSFTGRLILITDGEVGTGSVDTCDRLLAEWAFAAVEVYVIGSGANKSVHVPFCRNSSSTVYYLKEGQDDLVEAVSQEDLQSVHLIETISTLDEWLQSKDSITRGVQAKTVGTNGHALLRDNLIAMKSRIVKDESKKADERAAQSETKEVRLRDHLEQGHIDKAIVFSKNLIDVYYRGNDLTWSKEIDQLVSACTGALRTAFAVISNVVDRAPTMDPSYTEALPIEEADVHQDDNWKKTMSECIILMIDGVMAINISDEGPILANVEDKKILNDITNCPLNFLNYPEYVSILATRLCSVVSIDSIILANQSGNALMTCPLTRKDLLGAIPLGLNKDHCKAGNWTMAKLFFGHKLIGNADLWFAVILFIVYYKHTTDNFYMYLPQLCEHMKYRLTHHMTYASMTGDALYPSTKLYMDEAIWFVLTSYIHKLDLIRVHLPHIELLLKLNQLVRGTFPKIAATTTTTATTTTMSDVMIVSSVSGTNSAQDDEDDDDDEEEGDEGAVVTDSVVVVDQAVVSHKPYSLPNTVIKYIGMTKLMMAMLSWIKKDRLTLPNLVRALYQRAIWVEDTSRPLGGVFVFLDGEVSGEQRRQVLSFMKNIYKRFNTDTIYTFTKMITDSNLSAKTLDIPTVLTPTPNPSTLWPNTVKKYSIPICPTTCRPYYFDQKSHLVWKDNMLQVYEFPPDVNFLSVNANYGKYITANNEYPTKTQFLLYLSRRYDTLPVHIQDFIDTVYSEYEDIVKTHTVAEFVEKFKKSCTIDHRLQVEDGYKPQPQTTS